MKGATMLATLERLGVIPSFSRPSVSDDNAYSEALFKTVKFRPGYPGRFESIEAAKAWVALFVAWYNGEHRHSAIRYVTPAERHDGQDVDILRRRHELYQRARERHPERWSGNTRNWDHIDIVRLNSSGDEAEQQPTGQAGERRPGRSPERPTAPPSQSARGAAVLAARNSPGV